MAPELKTPDLDDADLRSAFQQQSPYVLDQPELEEDVTDADDALDRQIFAGLVTP